MSHTVFLSFQARHSLNSYLQIKVQKEKPGQKPYIERSIVINLRSALQVG